MISFISYNFNPYLELDFQNDAGKCDFFHFSFGMWLRLHFYLNILQLLFHFNFLPQISKIKCKNQFFVWILKKLEKFPHIGKVFAKVGQNFTIFSRNQKLCQLLGVGLIAIYMCPLFSKLSSIQKLSILTTQIPVRIKTQHSN